MRLEFPPEFHGHKPIRRPGVHFHQELELSARPDSLPFWAQLPSPVISLEVSCDQRGHQPTIRQLTRFAEKPALTGQEGMLDIQVGDSAFPVLFELSQPHRGVEESRPLRVVNEDFLDDSRRRWDHQGGHSPHAAGRLGMDFQFRWTIRSSPGSEGNERHSQKQNSRMTYRW